MSETETFRSFPCAHPGCTGVVLEGHVYCGSHGGWKRADREFRIRERQARDILSPRERREIAMPEKPRRRPQWDGRGAPVGTGLRSFVRHDATKRPPQAE